jgi:hypothetical protein
MGESQTEHNTALAFLLAMGLSRLPYDLLLNIAVFLDLPDIHALHLVRLTPRP